MQLLEDLWDSIAQAPEQIPLLDWQKSEFATASMVLLRNPIILPEAEQDAAQAYVWYEDQAPGLGEGFLRGVDACTQLIRRHPGVYQIVYESHRRGVVRRFPYVFYEFSDTTVII